MRTVVSFDAQPGGPLAERHASETRDHSEVEHRHQNRKQDPGSLSGVSGCTRATTEHAGDKRAEHNERNECDIVDQQSATTETKWGSESLSAMPGGAVSYLG